MSTEWQLNDNTWLPNKTNQFYVQYDFLCPCSFLRGKMFFFVSAVIFKLLSKSVINEQYLDK